jgi:hypothetical protein
MDPRIRLYQRYLDGECDPDEERLIQTMPSDPDSERFERLHDDLGTVFQRREDRDIAEAQVHRILARLPQRGPQALAGLSWGTVLVFAAATIAVGAWFGLAGTVSDLIPLTIVAYTSLVMGYLLMVYARQLRGLEAGLWERLLHRPVPVRPSDVLTYRAVAVLIIIGGIWLAVID